MSLILIINTGCSGKDSSPLCCLMTSHLSKVNVRRLLTILRPTQDLYADDTTHFIEGGIA